MANVPGVNGITGYVISNPEADPFAISGGPVDPAHENQGEVAKPYPWQMVPMGPYPGLINPIDGMVEATPGNESLLAGQLSQDPTADLTPTYHAAPFPNEGPNSISAEQLDKAGRNEGSRRQLLQSLFIHSHNTGAGLRRLFDLTLGSKQDQWTGFYNPVEGEDIVPAIPGSVSSNAGGFGTNDHTSNAYHKANGFNFNTSHRHRRFATGTIPGNHMWMKPGGRPMVRSLTGLKQFPSPTTIDPGEPFGYQGAILENIPSQYVPPAQPVLGNAPNTEPVPSISLF
jgi:hypothetical protein